MIGLEIHFHAYQRPIIAELDIMQRTSTVGPEWHANVFKFLTNFLYISLGLTQA